MNNTINAISPIDGRYASKTSSLVPFYSENALIKYRVYVEIEYLIFLSKTLTNNISKKVMEKKDELRKIYLEFSDEDALSIKKIETVTNHDVKAVEYFIKEKLQSMGLKEDMEWVHFGLTSQDINNTAIPLSIKEADTQAVLPELNKLIEVLDGVSNDWKDISLLARTHGQPASPTRLGKEIAVFVKRLQVQIEQYQQIPYSAKFGGATGNLNAHFVAFSQINWLEFAHNFVHDSLGLNHSFPTTQIEHYDNLAARFQCMSRIGNILIDFSRDIWHYISIDYFKQKVIAGEIGSSAMPHKVNPIDFENAEGNLGIANAIFNHLANKLPISRLQRDLTDSTVLRNVGVPYGHVLIALASLQKGMSKLLLNESKVFADLDNSWMVVAEAIQTVLRREKVDKPYEKLKELTRGKASINKKDIFDFIENLDISEDIKSELKKISPHNFTGI